MRKLSLAALTVLMTSGCAMPLPVTVASLVADGVSYATTKKSLTDHGLSALAAEDCAVHRLITEGDLCRADDIAIAAAPTSAPAAGTSTVAVASALPVRAQTEVLGTIGAPLPGVYLVIGSSRDGVQARRLAESAVALRARTLAIPTGQDRVMHLVLAGPLDRAGTDAVKARAKSLGLEHTWAVRVAATDWDFDRRYRMARAGRETASID